MRRHNLRATVLIGAMLCGAACHTDVGPSTTAEGYALRRASAQCLTPAGGEGDAGSVVIGSRVASVLLPGSATGVVCLWEEEGRWRLRPPAGTEILAE